ncbi:MAG: GH116 family glycosyl hydrolase [Elainellaceae cyanobacterium]
MNDSSFPSDLLKCAWTRPIGKGWDAPYRVRYDSNLDDGPWHGMPLGGFGAGCIGRSPAGDFNLWHIDGGEHVFQSMPACQFSVFEQYQNQAYAYALQASPTDLSSLQSWTWYPKIASSEGADGKITDGKIIDNSGAGRTHSGESNPDVEFNAESQHHATEQANPKAPSGNTGIYSARYPRSWFTYQNVFRATLTCEQFSPIWAGNYRESSYPVAMFEWTAHNPTDQPLTLSIMLTWQNMVGWFTNALKSPDVRVRDDGSPVYDYQPRLGENHTQFNRWLNDGTWSGCVMDRKQSTAHAINDPVIPAEGDGQWAIATMCSSEAVEVSYHSRWNPDGDGSDLWQSFSQDGRLANLNDETPSNGESIGVALAIKFTLAPGETRQIPFVLAWDSPVTEFSEGTCYYRRYTDFFGRSGTNAWAIATTALTHYKTWQQHIHDWQQPILDRDDLPDWFKMALFNELYDLTSGGTLWSAATERDSYGQFAVLECMDYCWYESLDVRLYGSFALLMLFPELDKAVLRAFARAIPTSDDTPRVIGYYYTIGADSPIAIRKAKDATPHDLGAPNEHPWEKTNYTSYQDCNLWKDLASDFVLQVYRDFLFTGATDVEFLAHCWTAIVSALAYLKAFDDDGDCIPENSGAPDQTFDDWRMRGISAYCGGLWLAALEAAIAIGKILQNRVDNLPPDSTLSFTPHILYSLSSSDLQQAIATYKTWLQHARPRYQDALWNGHYYRLDTGSSSDVVMADQLCGQFYARLLSLPDIVPIECARSALETVYDACFLKFHHGTFGAANGVRPDGSPVNPDDTHPLEVWTGINFGLAAFLIQMGMKDEALRMTEAVVRQIYENGLQFRTPEAITASGTFRACHYLRAMAIWLVYKMLNDVEG